MTYEKLQNILDERLRIANNKQLSVKERQVEDKITQTILSVAQLILADKDDFEITRSDLRPDEEAELLMNMLKSENKSSKHKDSLSDEQKLWLFDNFRNQKNLTDLTKAYNERFCTQVDVGFIGDECSFYGFTDYQL